MLFKSPHALILIACACLALIQPALSQDKPTASAPSSGSAAPADSANPASFAYDVVSIKPYNQSDAGMSMSLNTTPDGFISRGFPVRNLVMNAFPVVMLDQIVGLPDWANSDYYNIEAKMDEETAAAVKKLPPDQRTQVQYSMTLAILTDRFKLKYHKETRELPIYNLVVAKGGLKIKPTPASENHGYTMGSGTVSGTGIPLDSLAFSLSGVVGRMIVNKTGLTDRYSMDLKWNPNPMAAGPGAENSDPRPDLFTALEEQLGLKLESAKGPVDTYIIDHIEKPSEN
jgi:uncharacterized protein (TIGR03435 family)